MTGAIGLSGSTVSRAFIEASAAKLRELQELGPVPGQLNVVALVTMDRQRPIADVFHDASCYTCRHRTMTGEKRVPGLSASRRTPMATILVCDTVPPVLCVERGLDFLPAQSELLDHWMVGR